VAFVAASVGYSRPAPSPPQVAHMEFRDVVIDAKELAQRDALIETHGVFDRALSTMLRSPDRASDKIDLWIEDSPRAVREFFHDCDRRECRVVVTGMMGFCRLKTEEKVTWPCLTVSKVEAE